MFTVRMEMGYLDAKGKKPRKLSAVTNAANILPVNRVYKDIQQSFTLVSFTISFLKLFKRRLRMSFSRYCEGMCFQITHEFGPYSQRF